jgi:hypothetical protein
VVFIKNWEGKNAKTHNSWHANRVQISPAREIDALPVEVSDSLACNLLSLEHPAASCHSAYVTEGTDHD